MIKTTGAEWKAFMADEWPPGLSLDIDDEFVRVDGLRPRQDVALEEYVPDDAVILIEAGVILDDEQPDRGTSLDSFFKKWRKQRDTVVMVVYAPRDKADTVKTAIKQAGGKIR